MSHCHAGSMNRCVIRWDHLGSGDVELAGDLRHHQAQEVIRLGTVELNRQQDENDQVGRGVCSHAHPDVHPVPLDDVLNVPLRSWGEAAHDVSHTLHVSGQIHGHPSESITMTIVAAV